MEYRPKICGRFVQYDEVEALCEVMLEKLDAEKADLPLVHPEIYEIDRAIETLCQFWQGLKPLWTSGILCERIPVYSLGKVDQSASATAAGDSASAGALPEEEKEGGALL